MTYELTAQPVDCGAAWGVGLRFEDEGGVRKMAVRVPAETEQEAIRKAIVPLMDWAKE